MVPVSMSGIKSNRTTGIIDCIGWGGSGQVKSAGVVTIQ